MSEEAIDENQEWIKLGGKKLDQDNGKMGMEA